MLAKLLSQPDFLIWPEISLVLFTSIMLGVFLWIFRPGSKEYYEKVRIIDLNEGENHE